MSFSLFAQNLSTEAKLAIKETESTKSGNFQDVIASFYQLAIKNISQDEKTLEFNTTLFSLFKNYDKDILKTRSRKGIDFYQNFQIGGKVNLNSQYNIEGYGASITYSPINDRNKNFVDLTGTYYHTLIDQFENLVNQSIKNITPGLSAGLAGQQLVSLSNDLNQLGSAILSNDMSSAATMPYYTVFIADLDARVAADGIKDLNGSRIAIGMKISDGAGIIARAATASAYIANEKKLYYASLENKPLLTLSADGGFNTDGKFGRGNLGSVFLVGNSVGELDARAKFSYIDTLSTGLIRTNINAKLGYNFKVLKHKDGASYFEIKAYAEYNKILRNALPDEDDETFLANAEIRIRLMEDLWLPITIKYDVENANVLGFLNITYNFGDD